MMMLMMSFWLIVPLLLIGAVIYILGWRPQFTQMQLVQTSQTPLEILKARYVRGQISRDEYNQMCRDLAG